MGQTLRPQLRGQRAEAAVRTRQVRSDTCHGQAGSERVTSSLLVARTQPLGKYQLRASDVPKNRRGNGDRSALVPGSLGAGGCQGGVSRSWETGSN